MKVLAHSANSDGREHPLVEHLESVAGLAQSFASRFQGQDFAYWAGLWHDLGKFQVAFQSYLKDPIAEKRLDHSSAGAVQASKIGLSLLSFLIAGHHGGLPARAELKERLAKASHNPSTDEALSIAENFIQLDPAELPEFADFIKRDELAAEFFCRMLFSCLVDADFLDTEAHFSPDRGALRDSGKRLEELWKDFKRYHGSLGSPKNELGVIRDQIYQQCLAASVQRPGFFRLTVPTGGGKTLSGMAFALNHALRWEKERVIVAIPYTSIGEQTSRVYREIFGSGVLEHHSAFREDSPEVENPVTLDEQWNRICAENWDARVVVTTTVQLFESLFAARTSACRKLHNIANSVIILDEVQCLPTHLLAPILSVLRELVDHYGVSVILCTATQPSLSSKTYLQGLDDVLEIVESPEVNFQKLKRVDFEVPEKPWDWTRVAQEVENQAQVLAICNTKQDAMALLDEIESEVFHLSTQLCGAHRDQVLQEVKRRLKAGETCRLVSTQVVEAGVDLDFPTVLRAMGPLDRIVQAAGRCNREASMAKGRVVIFEPETPSALPSGMYQTGTDHARQFLKSGANLHNPEVFQEYFEKVFQLVNLDEKEVQKYRKAFDFPEVQKRFKLIDDNMVGVVVRPKGHEEKVAELLKRLRLKAGSPRLLHRVMRPFTVNLRRSHFQKAESDGLVRPASASLWEWLGAYDSIRGLLDKGPEPESLIF